MTSVITAVITFSLIVVFTNYVQQETLVDQLNNTPLPTPLHQDTVHIGGQDVVLALRKTSDV